MDRAGFSPDKVKSPVESMSAGDMLLSRGFSDFFAQHVDSSFLDADGHPDYDDENTVEEMRKLYRAYEMHGEVSKDLKKFFGQETKKDVGQKREIDANGKRVILDGIADLSNDLFDRVDLQAHLAEKAGTDPEFVQEIAEKAKEFYRLQQLVGGREEELQTETEAVEVMDPKDRELLRQHNVTYSKAGKVSRWRGPLGYLFRNEEEQSMADSLKKDFNIKLNEAEDTLKKFELGDSVLRLRELKNYFFTEFEPGKALLQEIRNQVQTKLDELIGTAAPSPRINHEEALANADTASRLLKSLKKVEERTGISYVDPRARSVDRMISEVDVVVEARLGKVMDEAVERFDHTASGNNTLKGIENVLKKFTTRNEVGTREGDDAREFVRETLTDIINSLPRNNGKRFILGYWLKQTFT